MSYVLLRLLLLLYIHPLPQDLYRPRESGQPRRKGDVSPNVWEDALKAVTWILMESPNQKSGQQTVI